MEVIKLKRKYFSETLLKITFFILKRALPSITKFDNDVKSELKSFQEGFKISLVFEPSNFGVTFKKRGEILVRDKFDLSSDLIIYFKDIKSSLKMMFGFLRLDYAFSENRLRLKGDIAKGMVFTRILEYLLTYLYPKFISKNAVKRMPKISFVKKFIVRTYTYILSIPFGI